MSGSERTVRVKFSVDSTGLCSASSPDLVGFSMTEQSVSQARFLAPKVIEGIFKSTLGETVSVVQSSSDNNYTSYTVTPIVMHS
jgi:hypothetical protein